MGIRLHRRFQIVERADNELSGHILDLEKKYDLTLIEILGILLRRASDIHKYAIRAERHPDEPGLGGDEE